MNPEVQSEFFDAADTLGSITITKWSFNGIGIFYFDGYAGSDMTMDLPGADQSMIMYFNLAGKSDLMYDRSGSHQFSEHQHNIIYCKKKNTQLVLKTSAIKLFLVTLTKEKFFEIGNLENNNLKDFNRRIASDNSVLFSARHMNIDFLMLTCISSVINCKFESSLKKMFLFSKVTEILVLQLESVKSEKELNNTYIKTDYDRERILFAKDYLLKNMANPPSLSQLARVSGINEFKLKKGFKELFNQSVFEYLSDVRLSMARTDLLDKTKTVGQIAFDLGYSSLQHFSSAFKRKFGVSPGRMK